jgi:phosphoribosyl-ATP pyrophosphohydrolase/phosphoribosyl-AMP cyclohydrolase
MNVPDGGRVDWAKGGGLVPAIVQDADAGTVLMLGYMNTEALALTLETRRVTFYSRSRARLWTKGETSGHYIALEGVALDCDGDTLLIRGRPAGPVCHTGAHSCFGALPCSDDGGPGALRFLARLEAIIQSRLADAPARSYTARLREEGMGRMAQKVGEEGLEVALAAVSRDDAAVIEESADLLYHLLVLLKSRGQSLADVAAVLENRHARPSGASGARD